MKPKTKKNLLKSAVRSSIRAGYSPIPAAADLAAAWSSKSRTVRSSVPKSRTAAAFATVLGN